MPRSREPIRQKPKIEDESTGNPPVHKGEHREGDEALPGKDGTKGGLNRYSGLGRRGSARSRHRRSPEPTGGTKQNLGRPRRGSRKPRRS